jgi:hypothetical protein
MTASLCAGIVLSSLLLNTATAQDLTTKLGSISVVSIDRMSLTNNGSAYMVVVEITFKNQNADPIRFRNANFDVSLNSLHPDGTNELVHLGPSKLAEVVLPIGSTNATFNIQMGPTNDGTTARLLQLFNAVGDPSNKVSLLLQGSSALDLKNLYGWIGDDKLWHVDLTFNPNIQRPVLFN